MPKPNNDFLDALEYSLGVGFGRRISGVWPETTEERLERLYEEREKLEIEIAETEAQDKFEKIMDWIKYSDVTLDDFIHAIKIIKKEKESK